VADSNEVSSFVQSDLQDESNIRAAVLELSNVPPRQLTINFVLQYLPRHDSEKMLLPKLLLCDLIRQASFGQSVVDINGRMEELGYESLEWVECLQSSGDQPVLWREFEEALEVATIPQRGNLRHIYQDESEVEPKLPEPIRLLNQAGVGLRTFMEMFRKLLNSYERPCEGLGHGCSLGNHVFALAAPLLEQTHARSPGVLEMLPLIMQLRKCPHINMGGQDWSKYSHYMESWDNWLQHHPAVQRYLDPVFCIVQAPVVDAPPGLAGILQRYLAGVAGMCMCASFPTGFHQILVLIYEFIFIVPSLFSSDCIQQCPLLSSTLLAAHHLCRFKICSSAQVLMKPACLQQLCDNTIRMQRVPTQVLLT
jgi:hypothetical protein